VTETGARRPLTARPALNASVGSGVTRLKVETVNVPAGETVSTIWRVDGMPPPKDGAVDLPFSRSYVLRFAAVRNVKARFSASQRFLSEPARRTITLSGLRAATNRTFDDSGNETTPARNEFAAMLFGGDRPISASDRWLVEVLLADNARLATLNREGEPELDFRLFQDMTLMLEYAT
jgi:hypothetical protein